MRRLVEELQQLLPFKKTTATGDVVLIAAKEPHILTYAYVRDIERDTSRREEWWHVHFTVLAIPLQQLTWTLRTAQMTGQEIFTMGGEERFIQAVDCSIPSGLPVTPQPPPPEKPPSVLKRVK